MRLTEQVHQHFQALLQAGDHAIDATCGHGHDSLFLSQCIGATGHVFAFDIQQQALLSAKARLQQDSQANNVTWIHASHAMMLEHIPDSYHKNIKAILFNLGYLPHSDKTKITSKESTLAALNAAISLLAKGGSLSILAYTAHTGGREEAEAVKTWAQALPSHFKVSITIPPNTKLSPPEWILIHSNT